MIQALPKSSPTVPSAPFSARTSLTLLCGDQEVAVSEIGPGFLSLQKPSDLPPGPATVRATVNGQEHRWAVVIPEGLDPTATEVMLPTLGPENYSRDEEAE
ncbi:hypothetical protein [Alienimonas californiensis]|uniref:Uncharacterized protein n=1 Tax=Alienimonas californiensis TaxID=2527989 RepID=A0A517P617_9PLAN|nr:hypothetical protein [Alienimonas californiensis]QDT14830.1 hypothetical protein CA12_09100 [Alienimonas californiensis]